MTEKVKYLSYIEDSLKHKNLLVKTAKTATLAAIKFAKKNNLYVTYQEGNKIIKEFVDGSKEVIGIVENPPKRVKVGESIKL